MQALKRQHLTRETVRRHLQKQAGGTVLGSGVRLPDTVPAFSGGIRQAALGRIRTLLQAAWLRLKAILTRTIRRAAGSLLALLGAGGVVLLLAMVIGAAAAVIGSPMGILFADESGDPNSIRIAEIVAETNADFGTAINDIVSAHPECSETTMEYDYEDGHTWASYWPEVLAVFAVQNNLNNDGDVVVIDESKKRLIQDTFWAMHEISAEVEEVTVTPEPTEDEPDPEPATEYILHIAVSSKSVDALADLYRFTQDQRDILHQLLSMLPCAMISIMYGLKWGFAASFVESVIQLAFGITMDGILGWGMTPSALIGTILLDYIVAYTVIGIAGIFRKKGYVGICCGTALAVALRFVCHFISGAIIFANFDEFVAFGASWVGHPWLYSFCYNGTYMLPELIFTVIAAVILFRLPQMKKLIADEGE